MVIFDNGECPQSRVGNYQRNCALEAVTDGWVYFLDDDTLIHPELFDELAKVKTGAVAFGQLLKDSVRSASPATMKVCQIDMGQAAIRREVIGDTRFALGIYEADGIFIETVYNSDPDKWSFIDKPLSYYNKLR